MIATSVATNTSSRSSQRMLGRLRLRVVAAAAAPADCELRLVVFAAPRATPRRRMRSRTHAIANQCFGLLGIDVEHPDLGRAIEDRQVADAAAELAVFDDARNAGVLEQVLEVR